MRYVASKWFTIFFFMLIASGIMPLQAEAASDPRFFGTYSGTHTESYTVRICGAWPLNWLCYEVSRTATFDIRAEADYRETRRGNGLVAGKGAAKTGNKNIPFVFSGVVTDRGRLRGSGIVADEEPATATAFLSGDGKAITIRARGRRLVLTRDPLVRPSNIAFGDVDTCVMPIPTRTRTVTIRNTGSPNLSITSVAITPDSDNSFSIQSETCPASLNPGDSCNVIVKFLPLTAGAKSGTLRIQSNDPYTPTSNVGLSGTVTEKDCDL
jgi:hypothetical protein